jgi:hypothetical protein
VPTTAPTPAPTPGPTIIQNAAPRIVASTETSGSNAAKVRSGVSSKSRSESSRKPVPAASSRSRRSSPWVSSVSRHWVVIRSDATKRSRIVASIGPHSHVQLGESRGDWRRIRAKGLSGWVEGGSAFVVVATR